MDDKDQRIDPPKDENVSLDADLSSEQEQNDGKKKFDPKKEITDREAHLVSTKWDRADERELDAHILSLLNVEPFFAYLSRYTRKVPTENIPTMGVSVVDGEPVMFWNPPWVKKLTPEEVRFVLKHEFYHLILFHCTNRKKDPPNVWNVATDLAINSILTEHSGVKMPKVGLLPGKRPLPPDDPDEKMSPEAKLANEKLADLIQSLPPMKASEAYYAAVMALQEELKQMGCGSEIGDETLDSHEGWEAVAEEDREYAAGRMRAIIRQAVAESDKKGEWGTIPSWMREEIRRIAQGEVDWRKVLARFVGNSESVGWTSSMKRINRKFPYIHPGRKRLRTARLAVYVDQSGSVGNEELDLFFGALGGLAKKTTFTVIPFDAEVATDAMFEWRRGQNVRTQRVRCGGTCFDAVVKHLNDNVPGKFDAAVILTDGCAPKPRKALCPLAWIIIPNGELIFAPDPDQTVVKIRKVM